MILRNYGWLPDIPDQRDYKYKVIRPEIKLPKEVDLRQVCSLVENQGALGSCTANALAGNLEFLDNKPDLAYQYVSWLFIYSGKKRLPAVTRKQKNTELKPAIELLPYPVCLLVLLMAIPLFLVLQSMKALSQKRRGRPVL